MPDPSRPESHLPLHPLEFQILLTLAEGKGHAYAVVRAIEARQPSWSRIHPTNLYRRLWRLESHGLVAMEREDEEGRKHFALTALGRRVAVAEAARLRALLLEAAEAGVLPGGGGRVP